MPEPDLTDSLRMPEGAAYGWLADHARTFGMPLGWGYCSALAAFASQPINASDKFPLVRSNIYVLLLGETEDGKSVAMRRAINSLRLPAGSVRKTVPSSDRGLQNMFPPITEKERSVGATTPYATIWQDEFLTTLSKIAITGSALASVFNTLFVDDDTESSDKAGVQQCNVRLSMLGAIPLQTPEDFSSIFSANTLTGLYSRFIFAPGPKTPPDIEHYYHPNPVYRKATDVIVPRWCMVRVANWKKQAEKGTKRGRLAEIALRIALISASANHDPVITEEGMSAAILFAEWQERVRRVYQPSNAKDDVALCCDLITRAMLKHGFGADGDVRWVQMRSLERRYHWSVKYGSKIDQAKKNLISQGIIETPSLDEAKEMNVRVPGSSLRLVLSNSEIKKIIADRKKAEAAL
jgi:hypothetical protein